ncbi:MAG TPA: hypothetical protein VL069_04640 [Opitutus sp.]|nr:hypothetical protein [Opitutus sp.]
MRAAIAPDEWKHVQSLDLEETGLVKIALPTATLDLAQPVLGDLRILGPGGDEVPYVIEIPARPTATQHAPRDVKVELQPLFTQITIETGTTQPIDSVTLTTPALAFVKAARLELSTDGIQWELAGAGFQLARQTGLESLALPLNKRTTFIRITIDDQRTAVVPFTGAILSLSAPETFPAVPVETSIAKSEIFAGETVLTIDLHARNLPLARLDVLTDEPLFARRISVTQRAMQAGEFVEQIIASGSIHRTRLESSHSERLQVPLGFTASSRELQVHIVNENSPPLAIETVQFWRRPVWLIFNAGTAGTYRVLTGNLHVSKPSYDIARFAADWKSIPTSAHELSPPESNPNYQSRDVLTDTPVVGTSLDVSKWKFRKTLSPAAAGVQTVELDLDVLAHALPRFGDLRLMRNGQQVPYLLERSSLVRSLNVEPLAASDPKRPQESQWTFSLPRARLRIQRLILSSSTRLFSRRVQVFEITTDRRGEQLHRPLSDQVAWSSTPDKPEPSLAIELLATPVTDRLYLKTDNGDNPPISLGQARVDYPVVRLLFRADAQALHLYYGAENVAPPKYDLELVARQLFSDETKSVPLGEEERLNGGLNAASLFSGKRGGIILWSSLALVVAVLLVAIGRLLPKTSDPAAK